MILRTKHAESATKQEKEIFQSKRRPRYMQRGKGNEAGAQTSISALWACPLKADPREMMPRFSAAGSQNLASQLGLPGAQSALP